MYRIIIGEISRHNRENWQQITDDPDNILETKIYEGQCNMSTLQAAGRAFHDEIQINWGSFAWKAFKSEIRHFFKRKGIPEAELQPFDEFKEYGVVYIDE